MFELTQLLGIRHLRNQWVRTFLSLLGIIAGITTFIFGPTLANTFANSLDLTADDIAGKATLEIRKEHGISIEELAQIRAIDGTSKAVPSVNGGGLLFGQPELMVFWGIDPTLDRDVRTYTVQSGDFIQNTGEILITSRYADDKGIALDTSINLISGGGIKSFQVVGILENSGGVARLNSGDILIMSFEDAISLMNKSGIDSVLIVPANGVSDEALSNRIETELGGAFNIAPPASRLSNAHVSSTILTLLISLITLLVLTIGSFLIYNTIAVSVAQRRSEIGILRALGLEKRSIRRMFMIEAGVMGLIGSLLGVGGGYLLLAISSNFNILSTDLFNSSPLQSESTFIVPIGLPFLAIFVGTIFPIVASFIASREAIRISPIEAIVQIQAESGRIPFSLKRLIIVIVAITGIVIFRVNYHGDLLTTIIFAMVLTYVMVMAMAFLVAPLLALIDIMVKWSQQRGWQLTSWLAMLNLTRRPKRVISTGILLTVGGVIFIYISQINYGMTGFVDEWGQSENVGNLTMVGAGLSPLMPVVNIPQTIIDEISARTDIKTIVKEQNISISSDTQSYKIRAIDLQTFDELGGHFVWSEGDETDAIATLTNPNTPSVLIHLGTGAFDQNMRAGGSILLDTPHGKIEFSIIGSIFGGLGLDETTLIMDKSLYARLWDDDATNKLTIALANGVDIQTTRRDLLSRYALQGVMVYDMNDMLGAFAGRLNIISVVSSLIAGLFTLILTIGIGSTFYVLILDRRREIGMLRALGMTKRQIRQSVLLEGILLFGFSCIISIPGAYLTTWLQQLSIQGVMGIKMGLQTWQVVNHLSILLMMIIIAMLIPSTIGGKTNILEAMHYE